MQTSYSYLIIGSGAAGVGAATEIRRRDKNSEIAIISEEGACFYSKVLLTDYLQGKVAKEKLFLRDEAWFTEQKIDFLANTQVKRVDTAAKKVFTTKGALGYDKLLIASGVYPKKLQVSGADRENVFYLWSMKDAERLMARIGEIKKLDRAKQRTVVIGGGFVCQTFLKIFTDCGMETHLLMRGDWYWSRFIGEQAGRLLEEKFSENNIVLHKREKVKEIAQDDDMLVIKTEKGKSIEAGLALAGIGTEPNIDFVSGTDIRIDDGILVDELMKTSAPDVWACGDVVNFYDLILEVQHRQGNWPNATRQGRIAGINMSGGREAYKGLTFFMIDVFGLEVMFLGDYGRSGADETVTRASSDKKKVREYYFKGDRLVGACLVGAAEDRLLIEAAIKAKIELNKEQRLALADENIPLGQSKLYGNK